MKRHVLLVALLASAVLTASLVAQGRGRGAGGGGNNNNVGMPWESLRAGVLARWDDVPRTAQKTEPFKIFDNIAYSSASRRPRRSGKRHTRPPPGRNTSMIISIRF